MFHRIKVQYLEPTRHIVERLATVLLEKRELSGDEVEEICRREEVRGEEQAT